MYMAACVKLFSGLLWGLHLFQLSAELLHPHHHCGHTIQNPIQQQSTTDENSVPLALHQWLRCAVSLQGITLRTLALRHVVKLPVNLERQEERQRHDGEQGPERTSRHRYQSFPNTSQSRHRQQQQNQCFRRRNGPQRSPLQRHNRNPWKPQKKLNNFRFSPPDRTPQTSISQLNPTKPRCPDSLRRQISGQTRITLLAWKTLPEDCKTP